MKKVVLFLILGYFLVPLNVRAQTESKINWITFEQLADSLRNKPKKVFIDFYTEWCAYCRKMDKQVFTKAEVVNQLNSAYYSVRMDAETSDTIQFDGKVFINREATNRRKGIHELAALLATREGQFAPPTLLVLNENFGLESRYFEYLSSKKLLEILKD